jgi:demethylmenaquinone methyltransferase / 2-methoxy-6-polyprenyl-1,4-benzoquinol methylase
MNASPERPPAAAISKDAGRIAGMFNVIAPRYDFLNRLLSAGFDRRWRKRAVQSLKLTGVEVLLDVCTGTADVALAARRAPAPARRVVGVDFAHEMLRVASQKIHTTGESDSVTLLRGDAMRLPIRDGRVQALTVAFGIRNVEDAPAACREMCRVLGPGGRLAILEFSTPTTPMLRQAYLSYFTRILPLMGRLLSRHATAYSYLPASVHTFPAPDRFAGLLQEAGFVDVSARSLTFGIVYLFCGRKAPHPRPRPGDAMDQPRYNR